MNFQSIKVNEVIALLLCSLFAEGLSQNFNNSSEEGSCVCVPRNDCKESDSDGVRIITPRNRFCKLEEVCCLNKDNFTEDAFLDLLLIGTDNKSCQCVEDTQCNDEIPDLASQIQIRTKTPCQEANSICCYNIKKPKCVCIHEDKCNDPLPDLFSVVQVRTVSRCSEKFHICCENPVDEATTPTNLVSNNNDKCQCVHESDCSDTLPDLSSQVQIRTRNPCDEVEYVCCYNIVKPKCVCMHEDKCNDPLPDLSTVIQVRTVSKCSEKFHVCCENPVTEPILPIPNDDACQCVPEIECDDQLPDLSSQVQVRTVNRCKQIGYICCYSLIVPNKDPIMNVSPRETIPDDKCICVHQDHCKDIGFHAAINERTIHKCSNPFQVCCFNDTQENNTPSLSVPSCGFQRDIPSIDLKIAGVRRDNIAKLGEFPWMVAILRKNDTGHIDYKCGGSLIHPSVVLTVAHCIDIDDGGLIYTRIGDLNFEADTELLRHAKRYAVSRFLHPLYSNRSLNFDLGLLFLNEPIYPTEHINTICLPDIKSLTSYTKTCYTSGWGKESETADRPSPILKKVELPLVSNHDCESIYKTTHLTHRFKLHHSFICAGGDPRKDACSGDGGSPLVCPLDSPKRYVQIGAVAWGLGCGLEGIPGVYASVKAVMDWIDNIVISNFGEDARQWYTVY